MLTNRISLCLLTLMLGLAGCVADGPEPEARKEPELKELPAAPVKPVDVPIVWKETPEQAAENFKVKFETSKGDVILEVHPSASPLGAAQFRAAVEDGVFDNARFFRVIQGFMAQFGIPGDPAKAAIWDKKTIKDEQPKQSNLRRTMTYAKAGPDSRTTQVFINYGDNSRLDKDGFAPFAEVVEGMDVIDNLFHQYGEGFPEGRGPAQDKVQAEGNAYLEKNYPELDYIKKATILGSREIAKENAPAVGEPVIPPAVNPAPQPKPEEKPAAEAPAAPEVKPAPEAQPAPEAKPATP